MKLETTLPEGAGFLHAVPLFNIFAVLLFCYAIGPKLEEKTGVTINMPASLFQLERFDEAAVITMTAEGTKGIYVGTQSVSLTELDTVLDRQLLQSSRANATVIIMADRMVSSDSLRQVAEVCMRKGLRVVLAGSGRGTPKQKESP